MRGISGLHSTPFTILITTVDGILSLIHACQWMQTISTAVSRVKFDTLSQGRNGPKIFWVQEVSLKISLSQWMLTMRAMILHTTLTMEYYFISIYISLISWYYKWQNTIEEATFVSKLICFRISKNNIKALTYKPQIFGMNAQWLGKLLCWHQISVKKYDQAQLGSE